MEREELERMKRDELLKLAQKGKIKGRYKMKKKELINALLKLFKARRKKKEVKIELPRIRKLRKRKESKVKKPSKQKPISPAEELAQQKQEVERTKFELGPQPQEQPFVETIREEPSLPMYYGEDRLTLLVRDPWWIFAYWEITPQSIEKIRSQLTANFILKQVLRVYDITGVPEFTGDNANSFFDIELTPAADNWYIHVGNPNRSYCAEIGLKDPVGNFYRIVRSNTVTTPRYGMSEVRDEEWMLSEEEYWRLFGLSGGYGIGKGSPELQELFRKRFEEEFASGFPASMFSWMQMERIAKGFWLTADAELIIYGATEPDAKLYIQGKEYRLRPDGTFSVRFALPDGKQEIPIEAISAEGDEKRKITIRILRHTD